MMIHPCANCDFKEHVNLYYMRKISAMKIFPHVKSFFINDMNEQMTPL